MIEEITIAHPCIQDDYTLYVHPDSKDISEHQKRELIKIAQIQQYYQQNPVKFVEQWLQMSLMDHQKIAFQMAWTTPNVLLNCTRGMGKALSPSTPVLTPNGSREFGDLRPGDYVYGPDGKRTQVLAISKYFENDCYKLTFEDGDEIIANENHEWKVYDGLQESIMETKQMSGRTDLWVPLAEPIQLGRKDLWLHPYILGLFLGCDKSYDNQIEVLHKDVEKLLYRIRNLGYTAYVSNSTQKRRKLISIYNPDGTSVFVQLQAFGINRKKDIPEEYLYARVYQRKQLIEGMIDGSNRIVDQGFRLYCDNEDFIRHLNHLFTNYGIRHEFHTANENSRKEKIWMSFEIDKSFNLTIHPRISNTLPDYIDTFHYKKIISIEKVTARPTRCIQVDRADGLFLCGRNNTVTHNSTLIAILLIAKAMLFTNYWSYIASGSASQAQTTFMTIEKLANNDIESFVNANGEIFKRELETHNSSGDGFVHHTAGYKCKTYGGSYMETVNSNIDKNRGKRGNVLFDECGFLSEEMLNVYGAFTVVDRSFRTGVSDSGMGFTDVEMATLPKEIPYQKFYISSASSTDTEYYRIYRDFAKQMLMGNTDYFVMQIDCELALHPTMNGKSIASQLTREDIESMMRINPEKARREYYCEFSTDAGANAIIRRDVITRNSELRKPLLGNDTGERKFIIAWDPARLGDNSVITISELYYQRKQPKIRFVNCIQVADMRENTPKSTREQVEVFREVLLAYNQGGDERYSNIVAVDIDTGSGGQGPALLDMLAEDWTDENGVTHFGLVDPDWDRGTMKLNPHAIKNVLHAINPAAMKTVMFDLLQDYAHLDYIKWTQEYDGRGYLTDYVEDGDNSVQKRVELTRDEESALYNIDLMKDQVVNIVRIERQNGKDSFEIAPEKRSTIKNDDHAYTAALSANALGRLMNDEKRIRKHSSSGDVVDKLLSVSRKPSINRFGKK